MFNFCNTALNNSCFAYQPWSLFLKAADTETKSSQIRFSLEDIYGQVRVVYSTAYRHNSWFHLAITHDGRHLKMYLNGVRISTGLFSALTLLQINIELQERITPKLNSSAHLLHKTKALIELLSLCKRSTNFSNRVRRVRHVTSTFVNLVIIIIIILVTHTQDVSVSFHLISRKSIYHLADTWL